MSRSKPHAQPISHVAAAAAAFAAACMAVPDSRADVESAAYSSTTSFVYQLKHMPDFDQRRMIAANIVGFPNNGNWYCVPTSMMNIFAYAANHGFPGLAPGPAWWQSQQRYNDAGNAIFDLGVQMSTNATTGTTNSGTIAGCGAWLSGSLLTCTKYLSNGSWSPKIEDLAWAAVNDELVALCYGRYTMISPSAGSNLVGPRTGGHCTTLVGANRVGDFITIKVRDPADDPDSDQPNYLVTQSTFATKTYANAKNRLFRENFGASVMMTALTYPVAVGETVRLIDSMVCVRPMYGMGWQPGINNDPTLIRFFRPQSMLGGGSGFASSTSLSPGQVMVDGVLSPESSSTLTIIGQPGAPNSLRRIHHANGQQLMLADMPGATDLALGRKRELYVLSPAGLDCFDVDTDEALPIGEVTPPEPCVAMCYDDARDEIVLLSSVGRKIYRYPHRLPAGGSPQITCIPASVPLGDEGWVDVNPADGKTWFATSANNSIYHVPLHATCNPVVQQISLAQIIQPRSLSFDDRGHMFIMTNSGVHELQAGPLGIWMLVPDPYFDTMVPGNLRELHLSRSRTNFDPAIHTGPAYHNIDPSELGNDGSTIALDCALDLNDDGQVNVDDLIAVILAWGPCMVCLADTNDDRVIDVDDLIAVILGWGACP